MTIIVVTLVFVLGVMFWDFFESAVAGKQVPVTTHLMYASMIVTLTILLTT